MTYKQHLLSVIFLLTITAFGTGCQNNKHEMRQKDAAKANMPYSPLVRIADSMNDSQDYVTAIKLYRQSLGMDPNDVDAQMGLARSLAAVGQYKKAIDTLEQILAKREHSGALRELGKIYLVNNEPDKCIDAYSRVMNKDANNIPAMNGTGVCQDIKGNHKEAQQWYQKALALSPDHVGVKSNMGLSLVLEGNYNEGIPILSFLADLPEATQRDRQNLAIALGLSGDVEQAAQLFSLDLDTHGVRNNLAMFHVYKKAEDAPKTLALKEIAEDPLPNAVVEESAVSDQPQSVAQVAEVY